jgi:Resolvase, N terminal domain
MSTGRFIAYYRVSTATQGRSGLGVEAQQAAVRAFLNGGDWKLLGEFTEVESGANDAAVSMPLRSCGSKSWTRLTPQSMRRAGQRTRSVVGVTSSRPRGACCPVNRAFPGDGHQAVIAVRTTLTCRSLRCPSAPSPSWPTVGSWAPGAPSWLRPMWPLRGLLCPAGCKLNKKTGSSSRVT